MFVSVEIIRDFEEVWFLLLVFKPIQLVETCVMFRKRGDTLKHLSAAQVEGLLGLGSKVGNNIYLVVLRFEVESSTPTSPGLKCLKHLTFEMFTLNLGSAGMY